MMASGRASGARGVDVLGERDQQADGEGAGQVDEQRDPRESRPRRPGGATRAGSGPRVPSAPPTKMAASVPAESPRRGRAGSSRRSRSRRPAASVSWCAAWPDPAAARPWPGPPVPPVRSHQPCRAAVRGAAPRRDPSPVGVAAVPSYTAGARPPGSVRLSRAVAPVRGGSGRARSPDRRPRTSTRPCPPSRGCAGRRRRHRPRR